MNEASSSYKRKAMNVFAWSAALMVKDGSQFEKLTTISMKLVSTISMKFTIMVEKIWNIYSRLDNVDESPPTVIIFWIDSHKN